MVLCKNAGLAKIERLSADASGIASTRDGVEDQVGVAKLVTVDSNTVII